MVVVSAILKSQPNLPVELRSGKGVEHHTPYNTLVMLQISAGPQISRHRKPSHGELHEPKNEVVARLSRVPLVTLHTITVPRYCRCSSPWRATHTSLLSVRPLCGRLRSCHALSIDRPPCTGTVAPSTLSRTRRTMTTPYQRAVSTRTRRWLAPDNIYAQRGCCRRRQTQIKQGWRRRRRLQRRRF